MLYAHVMHLSTWILGRGQVTLSIMTGVCHSFHNSNITNDRNIYLKEGILTVKAHGRVGIWTNKSFFHQNSLGQPGAGGGGGYQDSHWHMHFRTDWPYLAKYSKARRVVVSVWHCQCHCKVLLLQLLELLIRHKLGSLSGTAQRHVFNILEEVLNQGKI